MTDHEGNVVEDARVHIDFQGGITRSFEATTNDEGEYIQMGLASGPYIVTYTADGIGTSTYNLRLSAGQEFELDVQILGRGQVDRTGMSAEEIAALEAREATADAFEGGLEAARGPADYDEAAQLLTEAIETTPDCGECLRNLGIVEYQRGNYDEAEQALQRATEIARGRRGGVRHAGRRLQRAAPLRRRGRGERRGVPDPGRLRRAGVATPARSSIRASPPGTRGVPMKPAATSSRPWSWTRATARRTTGWGWRA